MSNVRMVSVKDTRDNLAELLEQVAISGQQFVITKFGKPKAKLSPVEEKIRTKKTMGNLPGFGMWADRKDIKDSGEWVTRVRKSWATRYAGV